MGLPTFRSTLLPKDKSHQMDFKGLELIADEFTGVVSSSAVAAITKLTNSSGGTVNNVVEVIPAATAATTDTTAASLTSTNAAITAIKNDIADLTAKVNEILNALD